MTPDEELASLDRLITRLGQTPQDQLPTRVAEVLSELCERRWRLRWARAGVPAALDPAAGTWPPPSPGDRGQQLAALERLERELTGTVTRLAVEPERPYLTVYLDGAFAERVFVADRDGARAYVWDGGHTAHPVSDVTGTARAVAAALATRRRRTQEHR